jgi:hypothetical protein
MTPSSRSNNCVKSPLGRAGGACGGGGGWYAGAGTTGGITESNCGAPSPPGFDGLGLNGGGPLDGRLDDGAGAAGRLGGGDAGGVASFPNTDVKLSAGGGAGRAAGAAGGVTAGGATEGDGAGGVGLGGTNVGIDAADAADGVGGANGGGV